MKPALPTILFVGLTAATLGSAQASVLILGNMASADDGSSSNISGGASSRGHRFTMGADDYTLDSIELRLRASTDVMAPRVKLFSDGGGTLGAELATFNYDGTDLDPTIPRTGTFTPGLSLTLDANTSYWVVLDSTAAEGSGTLRWIRDSSANGETPTGIGATPSSTSVGALSDSPTTIDGIPIYHNFNLNGTVAVPEPEEYVFAIGLGLVAWVALRRRQASRDIA